MIWTVTEFEPGRAFSWTAAAVGLTSVGEHRLTPRDDQSCAVTLAIRQSGPLALMVGLFTSGMTRRYVNLEAEGLRITFDPYQVAAYAAGPQVLFIPYSELQSISNPQGPIAAIAHP